MYIASKSTKRIYEVGIKYNGVGLAGTLENICDYPHRVKSVSYLCFQQDVGFFVSVPDQNGGVFKLTLEQQIWEAILPASPTLQVHGLAIMNEHLVFSNTVLHKIQMVREDNFVNLSGSGQV